MGIWHGSARAYRVAGSAILLITIAVLSACGSSGSETPMPVPSTDAGIVSYSAPYASFGAIERLDPDIDALIPATAELELLAEGFVWSEGPVWIADGNYLLFSDIPPNSIYRWTDPDGISLFMRPSGYDGDRTDIPEPGANGLQLDHDGRLLLAEHGNRRIARLESLDRPDGNKTTVADRYDGRRLNSPNDLVVAANGDIYFTDPPYGLAGQVNDPEKEIDVQGVYLIRASDGAVVLLATQSRPNGIGLSPDGRTLYVSNSDPDAPYIYAYDVRDDGTTGNQSIFFDAGELVAAGRIGMPDGMAIDPRGNLFATGPGGVLIIDAAGRHLGSILTGQATANCTFNEDASTLYITADSRLAQVRLR